MCVNEKVRMCVMGMRGIYVHVCIHVCVTVHVTVFMGVYVPECALVCQCVRV